MIGKWITDGEFYQLTPRNVFHKQLQPVDLPCDEHRNRHILFRKRFTLDKVGEAKVYISADDYYKLYINGCFAGQGPAPGYHFQYPYRVVPLSCSAQPHFALALFKSTVPYSRGYEGAAV